MVGIFFILGGCQDAPTIVHPCTFVHPNTFMHPQGCTSPYVPHTPLCIYLFSEAFVCCGGSKGLPYVLEHFPYTTPVWGASPSVAPPHSVVGFPVYWYVWGYPFVMWAFSPSIEGFGGVLHQWGVLGAHQHL